MCAGVSNDLHRARALRPAHYPMVDHSHCCPGWNYCSRTYRVFTVEGKCAPVPTQQASLSQTK